MAKAKSSKGDGPNVPHKHLYSRLSFLHQAATFLAARDSIQPVTEKRDHEEPNTASRSSPLEQKPAAPSSREATRLLSHLRGVSRKSQIRIASDVKHSICKRCDGILLPGETSSAVVTNSSRNGRKPWADVLELRCEYCGTAKRFPVGMKDRPDARSKKELGG